MNILTYSLLLLFAQNSSMATPLSTPFKNMESVFPTCPETVIINKTKSWNDEDARSLAYAQHRCIELYPDAPCCKTFIKRTTSDYSVVCGAAQ